jgi:hypothetical protein
MPLKRNAAGKPIGVIGELTSYDEAELQRLWPTRPEAPLAIPSRAYLAACSTPGGISIRIEGEAGSSQAPQHACPDRVATVSGSTEMSSEAPPPSTSQHVPSDH